MNRNLNALTGRVGASLAGVSGISILSMLIVGQTDPVGLILAVVMGLAGLVTFCMAGI